MCFFSTSKREFLKIVLTVLLNESGSNRLIARRAEILVADRRIRAVQDVIHSVSPDGEIRFAVAVVIRRDNRIGSSSPIDVANLIIR